MVDNRIPADETETEKVKMWFAPVLGADGKILASHQKEIKEGKNEKIENLSAYVQNGRLSGEVLEQVYQQAREEGVTQGQAEGYKAGYEQGQAKGQQDGYQAGLNQIQAEMVDDVTSARELVKNLSQPASDQEMLIKNWLFTTVTQICEVMAIKECEKNQQFVLEAIEKSVAALPMGAEHITMSLNPQDIESLSKYIQGAQQNWQIKEEAGLSRGSCIVKSTYSEVDFSVASRVQQLLQSIENSEETLPEEIMLPDNAAIEHASQNNNDNDINAGYDEQPPSH